MESFVDYLRNTKDGIITNENLENLKFIDDLHTKYKARVITLCGSSKFKEDFEKVSKILSLQGNLVISLGLFGHSGDNEAFTNKNKAMLDAVHLQKIDMSDEVFVINKDYYIGKSTTREISYALSKGKDITFYSKFLHDRYEEEFKKIDSLLKSNLKYIEYDGKITTAYCETEEDFKLYIDWFNSSIYNKYDVFEKDSFNIKTYSGYIGEGWYTIRNNNKDEYSIKSITSQHCHRIKIDNLPEYEKECNILKNSLKNTFRYNYSLQHYSGEGYYYLIPYKEEFYLVKGEKL